MDRSFLRFLAGIVWFVLLSLSWLIFGNPGTAIAENVAMKKMTIFRRDIRLRGKESVIVATVTRTWIDELEKLKRQQENSAPKKSQDAVIGRYAITDVYEISLTIPERLKSLSLWTKSVQSRDTALPSESKDLEFPNKLTLPLGTYLQIFDVISSHDNVLVFLCLEHGQLQLMKVTIPTTSEQSSATTIEFPIYHTSRKNAFPKILGARLVAYPIGIGPENKLINQFYVLVSVLSGPQNGVHVWIVKDDKPKRLDLSEPEDDH
jgi:hypothetical protein